MKTAVLIFYDGVCESTKEFAAKSSRNEIMEEENKWVFSSSGRHMFITFLPDFESHPGFSAKIHHGIKLFQKSLYQIFVLQSRSHQSKFRLTQILTKK